MSRDKLNELTNALLLALIFFVPWQTRWIFSPAVLNGDYFEYGSLSLYGTQLLLGLLCLIFLLKQRKNIAKIRSAKLFRAWPLLLFFTTQIILSLSPLLALDRSINLILALAAGGILFYSRIKTARLFLVFALTALGQSLLAGYQFFTQAISANKWLGLAAQHPDILGTPIIQENGERILRAFGSWPHPNILGGFLVISFFIIIAGIFQTTTGKKTVWYFSLLPPILFALLLSFSRGAWLALGSGLLLLIYFSRNFTEKKIARRLFMFLTTIFVLLAVSFPAFFTTRFAPNLATNIISNQTRLVQYQEFFSLIKDHWLFGTGPGNYSLALAASNPNLPAWEYQPIHNTFFLIWAETGLVGIFLLLTLIGLLFHQWRRRREFTPTRASLFCTLVALAVLALFDHYLWSFWSGNLLALFCLALYLKETLDARTPVV